MEDASEAFVDSEIKDIVVPEIKAVGENVKLAFKEPKLMIMLI